MDKGANQRFVLSNIALKPQRLYHEIYVLRGDSENRIKELKLEIKADRLSCHRFLTKRVKLLKIGARIRETSRRVWVHMASGYPCQALFALAPQRIKAAPT